MLEFKVIELSDKSWIDKLLAASDFRGCEYCFANNFAWRRLYETKITRYKNFYISCSFKGGVRFTFPAGNGDYRDVFEQMRIFSESRNEPLIIGSVTPSQIPVFKELYGESAFTVSTDEGGWDYVYLAEDLINLSGRKYHGKRNHLKKIQSMGYHYKPLTEEDFDDCITFAVNSYNNSGGYTNDSAVAEQYAINMYFSHYHEMQLVGGILRIDGKTAGFTIGERINSDTIGVHIEKADPLIDGAYPAINNEFVRAEAMSFRYVNREEDLGIEGLRRAKKSYHPAMMIEKYTITFN
ncbi:MAG: phosphatidylglycerol lysyltransferase domain-containing protein [Oscillospiraceae bacterium]|nr:phosphatidylglycerol lysyltransferase domain-containing protein [Oscillospiraceae bacterium]